MAEPAKKLFRSPKTGIIAGICSGIGGYFEIDPVIVRILFVFLVLVHGLGILLYLVLIFVIPKKPDENEETAIAEKMATESEKIKRGGKSWACDSKKVIGLAMIVIGAVVLLARFFPITWFKWDIFWPTAIILIGAYLILKRNKN
ncbi:MAG: PspC domain-containing protein [Patescibacteria group bacterium]|nr:PspC domain-containing protein [Patescibacteria group bacterium]